MKYLFLSILLSTMMGGNFMCKNIKTNPTDVHTIYLVRHAEKADDGTKDPPLTDEGNLRASNLAELLADKEIAKVYSTDYKRTRMTAKPLSEKLGIETTIYSPRDTSFYSTIRNEAQQMNILIVGHSNTTPSLTNSITGEQKYDDLGESVYDNLFMITVRKDGYDSKIEIFQ